MRGAVRLLLLALCLHASAESFSQKITLSVSNAPLSRVFDAISKQAGVSIVYKDELLKNAKPVTLNVKDATVEEVLKQCLKGQPFSYRIDKNMILIQKQAAARSDNARSDNTQASPPIDVRGRVTTEAGAPIGGVSVMVKGSNRGNLTNDHGDVLLEGIDGDVTLVVSSVGYESREIKLNGKTEFSVKLRVKVAQVSSLEINTGMFTRSKESFTGATTSYTGDQLKAIGNKNVLSSLATLDPAFVIVENNNLGSNPNNLPTIEVRGKTSISATNTTTLNDQFSNDPNQPLFILDGFESSLQAIYDLDMNQVATITILKDAAATAMYGAKSANGVVVVETKRPVPGELRVSYSADLSADIPDLSSYNLMNASEKLQFEKLAGLYTISGQTGLNQWLLDQAYNSRLASIAQGVNTDWLSQPVQLGLMNSHSLQVTGGNNELTFRAGITYRNENGVMKGSGRKTWSGNFYLTYRKGALNMTNIASVSDYMDTESPYGDFATFAQANPYYPKTNPDGSINEFLDPNDTTVINPLYNASLNSINQTKSMTLSDNLQAILTLGHGLRLQGGLMLNTGIATATIFTPPENSMYNGVGIYLQGNYTNTHTESPGYSGNLMLTYTKGFGKSQVNANLRTDVTQSTANSIGFSAVGFPFGTNGNPSYAYGFTPYSQPSSSITESRDEGFLASFNYAYDQRFLLDATYRLDGSSVFGSNQLFKPFAAAGLGWNINKEAFLRRYRWLNMLKLRGDIGYTGNENLGQFTSTSIYTYQSGVNNFGQGLDMTSLGNPNLKWQNTLQQSYGVDFTLWNNRISGYVEYYDKLTTPLAITAEGALPSSVGINSNYVINAGHLTTRGWDANLRFSPIYNMKQHIIWTIGVTGGLVRSTYGGLGDQLQTLNEQAQDNNGLNRYQDGFSPDDMWAVVSKGIDPATGQEIFQRKDGSLTFTYDPNDVVRVGNTQPKVQGVINTSLTYKNFSIGGNIRYSVAGYVFNSALYDKVENISQTQVEYDNLDKRALYDRWQKPGDIAQFKAIGISESTPMSSRFIEKDTHFDGESFNLSWRLATGWIRKLRMQMLTLSAYTNDIFRIERIKSERGIDYPFARSTSFSANISF
jgi:TonB-linked SusC/RagA family outer membrane protein